MPKTPLSPSESLEQLFDYLVEAYAAGDVKNSGTIQLNLQYKGMPLSYSLHADGNTLSYASGQASNADVTLSASLESWLALASKRLNPIWGVITGRLKFSGDTSAFSRIIPKKTFKDLNVDFEDAATAFEKNPAASWKIPNKVLILDSSPRGGEGYTSLFLQPFIDGIKKGVDSKGTVDVVTLSKYNVKRCIGCLSCWTKTPGTCVIADDAAEIINKINDADLVVYAFPLYTYTVPGILKNLMDRCVQRIQPYMIGEGSNTRHPRRNPKNQAMVVFSVCGFPEMDHFNGVRSTFRQLSYSSHTPIVGEIMRTACMFIPNNPLVYPEFMEILTAIQKAGEQVAQEGKISKSTLNKIEANPFTIEEFRQAANVYWHSMLENSQTDF